MRVLPHLLRRRETRLDLEYVDLVSQYNCSKNPQLRRGSLRRPRMSVVGCFGDCGLRSSPPKGPKDPKEYKLVFHPPIQTILREKDDSKWYTDMVNELATLGDDPNCLNEFGEAPLCVAAFKGSGMIVEEMLKQPNIRVNIKGKHGRTAMYLAAEGGHIFIVKLLLQHPDIDVNSRNGPRGATALMAASRRGHSRIVELLLQHPRCEIDANDKDGNTAIAHARTPSVKWRLHNHSHRSRSMETVLCTSVRHGGEVVANLCRVSPSADPSLAGTPNSPTTDVYNRRHSLETSITLLEGEQGSVGNLHSVRRASGTSSSGCSTRLSSASKGEEGEDLCDSPVTLAQVGGSCAWPPRPTSPRGRVHSSPGELLTQEPS